MMSVSINADEDEALARKHDAPVVEMRPWHDADDDVLAVSVRRGCDLGIDAGLKVAFVDQRLSREAFDIVEQKIVQYRRAPGTFDVRKDTARQTIALDGECGLWASLYFVIEPQFRCSRAAECRAPGRDPRFKVAFGAKKSLQAIAIALPAIEVELVSFRQSELVAKLAVFESGCSQDANEGDTLRGLPCTRAPVHPLDARSAEFQLVTKLVRTASIVLGCAADFDAVKGPIDRDPRDVTRSVEGSANIRARRRDSDSC